MKLMRHITKGIALLMMTIAFAAAPSFGVYAEGYSYYNEDAGFLYDFPDDEKEG